MGQSDRFDGMMLGQGRRAHSYGIAVLKPGLLGSPHLAT